MPRFVLLFFMLIFVCCYTANAQTWELGGTAGASGYIGDFNPTNPLKFTDVALGFFVKRNFNGFFSAKVNYTHGNIRGADSLSSNQQMRDRNLSFHSSLDEYSLTGELNFIKYIPEVGSNKFTPFIFAGIGLVKYEPMALYKGQEYELRSLMTEGQTKPYNNQTVAIPYGAGFKYNFSGKWNFIVDLGYRNLNTGYLDDVNSVYPNQSLLPSAASIALSDRSGEKSGVYTGSAGSQRGNMRADSYMVLGFTISYTFVTQKCYFQ